MHRIVHHTQSSAIRCEVKAGTQIATLRSMTPKAKSSILVVDDGPLARSIQILLEDESSHVVAVAQSAEQALTALDDDPGLKLLIIDLAILESDEARIRQRLLRLATRPALIVMTAHEAALAAAQTHLLKSAEILRKPIDPPTLLAMVGDALHDGDLIRRSAVNAGAETKIARTTEIMADLEGTVCLMTSP